MAYKSQVLLGRIVKISGYDGVVSVKLEKALVENIPEMESVFIETEGRLVPFFISLSEYTGGDILKLRFEGYESAEKVNEFSGCRLYLTTGMAVTGTEELFDDLKGFKVLLSDNTLLGTITEVTENPGQWMLTILSLQNKEILVPLHEHFIVKADRKKKTIIMELPDGLIEVN